jgi:hypothetical protein
MIRTQDVSEEQLSAYVDGELDAPTAAQIDAALALDNALAARVAQQRALRRLLQQRFDPVLQEPVPEQLLEAMRIPPVADMQAARERRAAGSARRWSWQEWGAMAATLVLGVLGGITYRGSASDQELVTQDGGIVAGAYLASALSNQLAGEVKGHAGTQIGLSIRAENGEFCRSFTLRQSTAGLACRRGQAWAVDTLAAIPVAGPGEFRQAASSLPEALRVAIEQRMSGEPLTEAEEAEQVGTQWRAGPAPAAR